MWKMRPLSEAIVSRYLLLKNLVVIWKGFKIYHLAGQNCRANSWRPIYGIFPFLEINFIHSHHSPIFHFPFFNIQLREKLQTINFIKIWNNHNLCVYEVRLTHRLNCSMWVLDNRKKTVESRESPIKLYSHVTLS